MASRTYYAHSLKDRPYCEWQKLDDHLRQTAELAELFAGMFAPGWGRLAGLWHDAGKYQLAFQNKIDSDPNVHVDLQVDHSTVGALIARERSAAPLAFVIAGHHGGLPDSEALRSRLLEKAGLLPQARADGLPRSIEEQPRAQIPASMTAESFSLWIRFVFSALVDADFLDTAHFYNPDRGRGLPSPPTLDQLQARLGEYLARKTSAAPDTAINRLRARVLDSCRRAADLPPGAFTLTVPTGGGKTLASLAFALYHAIKYAQRRVIVVIPYTSIIEQTAAVYREALGDSSVVEHHVNVDPEKETPANRIASENWDAPVVVTTSVQFFESLYANRPSRCRKLHRIARSVVVFDEVQTFPPALLAPVKHALRELIDRYAVTAVFCTATQPTLFPGAREILANPREEFAVVAPRCAVIFPPDETPTSWDALAGELQTHAQVLAIVHKRADAQQLAQLTGDDCLHLSARMCAEHRSQVLTEVKRRLHAGEPCRLVATQLVEAGVDVDFPEVYRAFAGADSLAQAAGRCNREGRGTGRLHIFFAPTRPPRGILRTAEEHARIMWQQHRLDLTVPGTFTEYFSRLYNTTEQDARAVLVAENQQQFHESAERFRMIEDLSEPVAAPFGDWRGRVEDIRRNGISRDRMRRLQRFLVGLYSQEIRILERSGAIEKVEDTFWAPVPGYAIYSERWGFGWQGEPQADPERFIVADRRTEFKD